MRSVLEPKVPLSATVEPEQREALEELARRGDRTLSQEVRIAVREHLARNAEGELVVEEEAER